MPSVDYPMHFLVRGAIKAIISASIRVIIDTEVICVRDPEKYIDPVEYATLEWVDWFNQRQLVGPTG